MKPGYIIPVVPERASGWWPWVSREAYDLAREAARGWQSAYAELAERYHALRVIGSQQRPVEAEQAKPVSAPTSDIDLVYNTQRQMAVDSAYEDFLARGATPEEARAEAQRAVDSIFAPIAGEFQ